MVRKKLCDWYVDGSTWQYLVSIFVKGISEVVFAILLAGFFTLIVLFVFPIELVEQNLSDGEDDLVWAAVWVALTTLGLRFTICTYINDWNA